MYGTMSIVESFLPQNRTCTEVSPSAQALFEARFFSFTKKYPFLFICLSTCPHKKNCCHVNEKKYGPGTGCPLREATEKVPIWSLDILYIDINTVIAFYILYVKA
jgi:hypothetical protein